MEPWKELPHGYKQVESWQGRGYEIDEHIAREGICKNCGKEGLQWKGFVRKKPRYSYFAWIVCPQCGEYSEL